MKWVFRKNLPANRKAFTLMEVSVALIIVGMIAATVLIVVNRAIDTVVAWQTKMEAFGIARENMEKLLMKSTVGDLIENGISEKNPDISWETTVESFYEPISNRMWARAVCTSKFKDNDGNEQKVELTQWITSMSKEQVKQILESQAQQKQVELAKISEGQTQDQSEQQQNQDQQQEQSPIDEAQSWNGSSCPRPMADFSASKSPAESRSPETCRKCSRAFSRERAW
jgi:prepilin-type N-terminal cleavage/methylation domain-containing protein